MDRLLPNMVVLEQEERKAISPFCSYINKNKDNLSDDQKEIIADYIIRKGCGVRKDKINKGIYSFLKSYLITNIGDVSFNLYGNSIREISLGNITVGPLFSSNFTNEELSDRYFSRKNSCGVLPSVDNMKRLFISYGDKTIFSNDIGRSDRDVKNVHIREYYFNKDDVLKENDNPYIYRFTSPYKDELQIDVLSFDKEGVLTDRDVYIDYLESSDGKNYKVVRQVHNELEDINSLHGKVR